MSPDICFFCGATMTPFETSGWICNNPACEFVGLEQVSICYRPAAQQQQPEAA